MDCYVVYYTMEDKNHKGGQIRTYKSSPNEGSISQHRTIREIEGWSPIQSFPSFGCMADSSEEAITKSVECLFNYQPERYGIEVDTNVEVNITMSIEE